MEQIKKIRSRDAARQRRGQQNDEFGELAASLPLPASITEKLDRLCVMRLSTSYIKNKHVIQQIKDSISTQKKRNVSPQADRFERDLMSCLQEAMGGFVFVLAEDGQCLYISPNIIDNLGLQQLDITGQSFYKYIHPCDQDNLANQLGGQVPLEDMEIFDGMFCSDNAQFVKNPKRAVSKDFMNSPHRSFFLRMKSTLTSRGKSVNINASIFRAVQCSGTMQMYRTKLGVSDSSLTRCMIGIGIPLMSKATYEVPADRQTFITKHSMDFVVTHMEDTASNILGYENTAMNGKSWYLFTHICDNHVLKTCHTTLLKIGQAVSGYYRVILKNGGWIWMQTKANVVYVASTGQPQHIMCIHYVISGLELEDQVLSNEQIDTPSSTKKRSTVTKATKYPIYYDDTAPIVKYSKMKENIKVETEKPAPIIQSPEPLEMSGVDLDDSDEYDDLPGLEFLDVTDGYPDEAFSSRSPYIPTPFADSMLKDNFDDLGSPCDDNELIYRAPYIPPPCIDTILSFDDLSYPDLQESSPTVQIKQTPNSIPSELYDFGNARVPYHLLASAGTQIPTK